MATELQQMLRSLCSGMGWTYAIFWRLMPRPEMILTWYDAYYENCGNTDLAQVSCSTEVVDHLDSFRDFHDPLGFALAKLSYYAYPLGKGIIGQVAFTGKHKWINIDDYIKNSDSSFKDLDAWKTQFLAGIKTVFVGAVPYGVVQLGSLLKIDEDMKLMTHVLDAFHSLQDVSLQHQSSHIPSCVDGLLHEPNLPVQALVSEVILDNKSNINKTLHGGCSNDCPSMRLYHAKRIDNSNIIPANGFSSKLAAEPFSDCEELKIFKHDQNSHLSRLDNEGEITSLDDRCSVPESNLGPHLQKAAAANSNLSNASLRAGAFVVDLPCTPSGFANSSTCDGFSSGGLDTKQSEVLQISKPSKELQKDTMKKLDTDVGLNYAEIWRTSLRFSTISELHEALGSAFYSNSNLSDSEKQKVEAPSLKALEEINNSGSTNEFDSDHLLDAVVARACCTCSDNRSEKSVSESRDLMCMGKISGPSGFSMLTINSADNSFDKQSHMEEDSLQLSERSFGMSASAISSAYPSSGVEANGRSTGTAKNSRKRSRPGENRRPRPRDRQLIQDRLKELRELVPHGSKCSIDSLLEHTIKHMLFLQSITKHADNINRCTESKRFCSSDTALMGSSGSEQGASWAVEVGSHLKIHSIMAENLSNNGQLLVEMLCEDGSHFLEIAEAMRSLGLTILKGATEAHGDKIWICFVVEGQKDTCLHRMDILWSLVEMLQLEARPGAP